MNAHDRRGSLRALFATKAIFANFVGAIKSRGRTTNTSVSRHPVHTHARNLSFARVNARDVYLTELLPPPGPGPPEHLGHDLDDPRRCLRSRLVVDECQARSPCEHVHRLKCVLLLTMTARRGFDCPRRSSLQKTCMRDAKEVVLKERLSGGFIGVDDVYADRSLARAGARKQLTGGHRFLVVVST